MAAIPEANRARRVARHDREVGEEEHRPHERRLPRLPLELDPRDERARRERPHRHRPVRRAARRVGARRVEREREDARALRRQRARRRSAAPSPPPRVSYSVVPPSSQPTASVDVPPCSASAHAAPPCESYDAAGDSRPRSHSVTSPCKPHEKRRPHGCAGVGSPHARRRTGASTTPATRSSQCQPPVRPPAAHTSMSPFARRTASRSPPGWNSSHSTACGTESTKRQRCTASCEAMVGAAGPASERRLVVVAAKQLHCADGRGGADSNTQSGLRNS